MKIEVLAVNKRIDNSKENNKKMKISFIINILISILTINAIIMCIMGFNFMSGYEPYPELLSVPIYNYYTVHSFLQIENIKYLKEEKKIFHYYIIFLKWLLLWP